MALNVDVGTITQPGATGNQTYSLPADFDPKALILWATPATAAGSVANAVLGLGFATYRAAAVQQFGVAVSSEDAVATSDTYQEQYDDACLVCFNATNGARDMEIDFVSFTGGASSEFVLNWVNLFTTASVIINYMVIGGSDVADALVSTATLDTTSTTQDVTVASGFGQPDLVFFARCARPLNSNAGNASVTIGFGKKGEDGRGMSANSDDAEAGAAQNCQAIWNNRLFATYVNDTAEVIARFSATGSWPTDGFELTYDANPSFAEPFGFLAIKGTFTMTTGQGAAPIAGAPPVTQNLAHTSPPKACFLVNVRTATANTLDTSSANNLMVGVGAGDGTTEVWSGYTDDDGIGTQRADRMWTNAKTIQYWTTNVATPVLSSEADGSVSGNDFVLSWNDIDATAFLYQWLLLGDGPSIYPAIRQHIML